MIVAAVKWKKCVSYLIFFVVFFYMADKALFFLIREFHYHWYYRQNLKRSKVFEELKKHEYDALIFGSSRANAAIIPIHLLELLKIRAHKEAANGKYAKYNYIFYKKYLAHKKKPRMVFYGIDYHLWKMRSGRKRLATLNLRFGRYIKRLNYADSRNDGGDWLGEVSYLFRIKPQIDLFLNDILTSFSETSEKKRRGGISGWLGKTTHIQEGEKPDWWRTFPYRRYPGFEGRYFQKLIEELDRQQVLVFLVILPDYIGTYESHPGEKLYQAEIRAIADRYKSVFCLNYNDGKSFNLKNPRYFFNGDWGVGNSHLSSLGARVLCEKLAADVKRIQHLRKENRLKSSRK